MTPTQLRAIATGFIELGNIIFTASAVAVLFNPVLFTPAKWPPVYEMLISILGGLVLGMSLYTVALDLIRNAEAAE